MGELTHAQVEKVKPIGAGCIQDIFQLHLSYSLVTTTQMKKKKGHYPGHGEGNVAKHNLLNTRLMRYRSL